MSIVHFFDHADKKNNREHFAHLVQLARADGNIEKQESELLHRIGKRMGFTDPEIDHLIDSKEKHMYNHPYELEKRFIQLFELFTLIMADGQIEDRELKLVKRFATGAGFTDLEIEKLIPFLKEGIEKNMDEEDLFTEYKKWKRKN